MKQRDKSTHEDEDLRALFDELRREEQNDVPPYRRASWVRVQPEGRSILKWRLVIAGACATVVTAGLAALVVGWSALAPIGSLPGDIGPAVDVARNLTPRIESTPLADSAPAAPVSKPNRSSGSALERAQRRARRPNADDSGGAVKQPTSGTLSVSRFAAVVPDPETPIPVDEVADELQALGYIGDDALTKKIPSNESVTVVATADVVDLEETRQTTEFSDEFIRDLPIQGRFYTNVLTLAPAVWPTRTP
jgi:hypothetical protein